MGNWLISAWERIEKAFLVSDRYVAYLNGFKTTLIISTFCSIAWCGCGNCSGLNQIYGKSCREKYHIDPSQLDSQYLYRYYPGNAGYVQLLIIYFIIFAKMNTSPIVAAVLCFGINSSAYVAEIIRAGIEAVDAGQMEAGRSLGLGWGQTMVSIIMPQAIKNILPALGNEFIVLIKETAIVGTIAVRDVTKAAQNVGAITYDLLPPLLITAAMYLAVVIILTKLLSMFERRLAQSDRR